MRARNPQKTRNPRPAPAAAELAANLISLTTCSRGTKDRPPWPVRHHTFNGTPTQGKRTGARESRLAHGVRVQAEDHADFLEFLPGSQTQVPDQLGTDGSLEVANDEPGLGLRPHRKLRGPA